MQHTRGRAAQTHTPPAPSADELLCFWAYIDPHGILRPRPPGTATQIRPEPAQTACIHGATRPPDAPHRPSDDAARPADLGMTAVFRVDLGTPGPRSRQTRPGASRGSTHGL